MGDAHRQQGASRGCSPCDPDAPALREALDTGGRAITVLDGDIAVLATGADPDRLVSIVDVPVTLSGLSRAQHRQRPRRRRPRRWAWACPARPWSRGCARFAPDDELNPGRMNTYTVRRGDGSAITVIIDLAHNEAGLEALLDVARRPAVARGRVHLGLGTRRRPHRRDLLESHRRDGRAAGPTGSSRHTRSTTCAGARWRTSRRTCAIGLARAGSADIESYDDRARAACRPWCRAPPTATSWR